MSTFGELEQKVRHPGKRELAVIGAALGVAVLVWYMRRKSGAAPNTASSTYMSGISTGLPTDATSTGQTTGSVINNYYYGTPPVDTPPPGDVTQPVGAGSTDPAAPPVVNDPHAPLNHYPIKNPLDPYVPPPSLNPSAPISTPEPPGQGPIPAPYSPPAPAPTAYTPPPPPPPPIPMPPPPPSWSSNPTPAAFVPGAPNPVTIVLAGPPTLDKLPKPVTIVDKPTGSSGHGPGGPSQT